MSNLEKKLIVISAINFTEGGPLTILNECLSTLSELATKTNKYSITAFIYSKNLCYYPNINYIEIQGAKKSWVKRLYFEYYFFNKYSKAVNPFLWLSLHDITPNVKSERIITYFHNPSPFRRINIKDAYFSFSVFAFTLFYKYLYKVNSHKNKYIIVQQDWLRNSFSNILNISKEKIIVAYPKNNTLALTELKTNNPIKSIYHFIYPAFPRSFKNFEIICKAASILDSKGILGYKILLTIKGNENKYSKWLYKKYSHLQTVSFIGLLSNIEVLNYYAKSDCLIFPSLLETWGLPISEFSIFDKPILAADLHYAHETASCAKYVNFFDPKNAEELANKMELLINGDMSILKACPQKEIKEPFYKSWSELFNFLLN